jgi:hypothetical protein
MNEVPASKTCLYCEAAPAITPYGLCASCNQNKALRRIYRNARGRTPEWETHLLYLTERAKRRLPLFVPGYQSPYRPSRGTRKRRRRPYIPLVRHMELPPKELDE